VTGGRALALQRTIVVPAERGRFLERARHLRGHYSAHECRYWLFEDSQLPGAFIEFTEAGTMSALTTALAGAHELVVDPARIYQEVEF
jgi:hypothetical protein